MFSSLYLILLSLTSAVVVLTGEPIDWHKLERYGGKDGLLRRSSTTDIVPRVVRWYEQCGLDDVQHRTEKAGDQLLGIASRGGFLQGTNQDVFTLKLVGNLNVLIGDRGTGKSTVVQLLGMLRGSRSEHARQLSDHLLNPLKNGSASGELLQLPSYPTLRDYGINQYACFFRRRSVEYAWYVDVEERTYDILQHNGAEWLPAENDEALLGFPMYMLNQGEVMRISEMSDRYFVNRILDALYEDLGSQRYGLRREVGALREQFKHYRPDKPLVDVEPIRDFLREKEVELASLEEDLKDHGHLGQRGIGIIKAYAIDYRIANPQEKRLVHLLSGGRLSLVGAYLAGAMDEIDSALRNLGSRTGGSQAIPESSGKKIVAQLHERLRTLRLWSKTYGTDLKKNDTSVLALASAYAGFLESRQKLLSAQEQICRDITQKLLREPEARVYTPLAEHTRRQDGIQIEQLKSLERVRDRLINATTDDFTWGEFENLANHHRDTIYVLIENLKELTIEDSDSDRPSERFLFVPVEIELKQGQEFRVFSQLSFGQKSGIILQLVLKTANMPILIIDQPEDNLDAASIVNMLAPTLSEVAEARQVAIATHSSNLVMGFSDCRVVVLESNGESGRIRSTGSLSQREIVREMMNVLEGGLDAFHLKMRTYEDFIQRLSQFITDIDMLSVETSFRRRTIDRLNNNLQALISDKGVLDVLRHELKQRDITALQREIEEAILLIADVEKFGYEAIDRLLSSLARILLKLDADIDNLHRSIDDIRQMETEPVLTVFCLRDLLEEIGRDVVAGRPGHNISIIIDKYLNNISIYADRGHMRLVFTNLLNNSLRATEKKVVSCLEEENFRPGWREEIVQFHVISKSDDTLVIELKDNGCGIKEDIRERLYEEPCSDQVGKDHGIGGVIIRKLLERSGGSIHIMESETEGESTGTVQQIALARRTE